MKKKKRKIKYKNLLLIILVFGLISFSIYNLLMMPIKGIFVVGNNLVKEKDIVNILLEEPLLLKDVFLKSKLNKIEKNPLIKNAYYKFKLFNKIEVQIVEEDLILYDRLNEEYITKEGKKIKTSQVVNVSILENYIIDVVQDRFYKSFSELDKTVLSLISEVKYSPTKYDETRFIFTMTDENQVVVNIVNLKNVNYYLDIVKEVNKKGTLYLDSKADASQFVPF